MKNKDTESIVGTPSFHESSERAVKKAILKTNLVQQADSLNGDLIDFNQQVQSCLIPQLKIDLWSNNIQTPPRSTSFEKAPVAGAKQ